jgi:hypothetical protein
MSLGATISLALVLTATAICCAGAVPVANAEKAASAKSSLLQCRLYFGCVPVMRPAAN